MPLLCIAEEPYLSKGMREAKHVLPEAPPGVQVAFPEGNIFQTLREQDNNSGLEREVLNRNRFAR